MAEKMTNEKLAQDCEENAHMFEVDGLEAYGARAREAARRLRLLDKRTEALEEIAKEHRPNDPKYSTPCLWCGNGTQGVHGSDCPTEIARHALED